MRLCFLYAAFASGSAGQPTVGSAAAPCTRKQIAAGSSWNIPPTCEFALLAELTAAEASKLAKALGGSRLKELVMPHSSLGSEGARVLGIAIGESTTLTSLTVADDHTLADTSAISSLAKGAGESKTLTRLALPNCSLTGRGVQHVASHTLGRASNALKQLSLADNPKIGDDGAQHIRAAILAAQGRCVVEKIGLQACSVGDDGAEALASALRGSRLDTLGLRGNRIGARGASALATALLAAAAAGEPPRLEALYLQRNRLGDGGAEAMARLLEQLPQDKPLTLNLLSNGFGVESAQQVARRFAARPPSSASTLCGIGMYGEVAPGQGETLDLNGMAVGEGDLEMLRAELSHRAGAKLPTVSRLSFAAATLDGRNGDGDSEPDGGALLAPLLKTEAFGRMLEAAAGLRALDLSSIGLGASGGSQAAKSPLKVVLAKLGEAAAAAAAAATTDSGGAPGEMTLRLDDNGLSDGSVQAVADAVRSGGLRHLRALSLRSNDVTAAGAKAVADVLRDGGAPQLMRLDLSTNPLQDEGVAHIVAALRRCYRARTCVLASLRLEGTDLSPQACIQLADLVETSPPQLKEIKMRSNAAMCTDDQACLAALSKAVEANANLASLVVEAAPPGGGATRLLDLAATAARKRQASPEERAAMAEQARRHRSPEYDAHDEL